MIHTIEWLEKELGYEGRRPKLDAKGDLRACESCRDLVREGHHLLSTQYRLQLEERFKVRELEKKVEKLEIEAKKLKHQLFEKKSEKSKTPRKNKGATRKRGQRPGKEGPGRSPRNHLPEVEDHIDLPEDDKTCQACQEPLSSTGATEDSSIVEVEVKAYTRRIKRRVYARTCSCPGPKTVTAPRAPKLFPKGSYGCSFWAYLLVDKFFRQIPTTRTLLQLEHQFFLPVSKGTVTGGLKRMEPLLRVLHDAIVERNRNDKTAVWYIDETSWPVFEYLKKWYLWVYLSSDTVVFEIADTKAADIPAGHFLESTEGHVHCDRAATNIRLTSKLREGLVPVFCWLHVRRQFLDVGRVERHREWAMEWHNRITTLIHLDNERKRHDPESESFQVADEQLRSHLASIEQARIDELSSDPPPARKSRLVSLEKHWPGLIVFVDNLDLEPTNNAAERELRSPVVGRKGYYGSGVEWSAKLAVVCFTIFYTLRKWGIDPWSWTQDYLEQCAENGGLAPPNAEDYLPWNMSESALGRYGGTPPVRSNGHPP